MGLHRVPDGLSSCDPHLYASRYEVGNRLDIKRKPVFAARPAHRDTLEISRDSLEREALNRLRHTSKYVIAQPTFMRIGKYLFLAVALPPYLTLYALPKWLWIEGLPTLFSFYAWMWQSVQKQIERPAAVVSGMIAQGVRGMRGAVRVLVEPIIRTALEMAQWVRHMREGAWHLVRRWGARLGRFVFPGRLAATVEREWHRLSRRLSQIGERAAGQIALWRSRIQQLRQRFLQVPSLAGAWSNVKWKRLREKTGAWGDKYRRQLERPRMLAAQSAIWISTGLGRMTASWKRHLNPIFAFYQREVRSRWLNWSAWGRARGRVLSTFFQQCHRQSLAFLNLQRDKFKGLSSRYGMARPLFPVWADRWPLMLKTALRMSLFHPAMGSMVNRILAGALFAAQSGVSGIIGVLHLLGYAAALTAKMRLFLRGHVQRAAQLLNRGGGIVQRLISCFFWHALYYVLLVLMIFLLIAARGARELGRMGPLLDGTLTRLLRKHTQRD